MKSTIIYSALLVLVIVSCNSKRENTSKTTEMPKALEEKTAFSSDSYSRNSEDLLEDLYQELAAKTPDLTALDKEINELNNSKSDSSKSFYEYNSKNESYYSTAKNRIANSIKDSLLRQKISSLLENSLHKYKTSTAKHNALLANIDSSDTSLSDLYLALKITKTLPIIEQYQQQHLPSTKPLEGYLQQQQKTIKKIETNLKK